MPFSPVIRQNQVIVGGLRLEVFDDGLIRIEYAPDGNFVDSPTLAVSCRESAFGDFSVRAIDNFVEVVTNSVRVLYYPDYGAPRGGVLDFFIHGKYHTFDEENPTNLGSCRDSLDGLRAACPVADGVIATSGWYMLDDTASPLTEAGNVVPRRTAAGYVDRYLLVYGRDYPLALRLLGKLTGFPALPPRRMFGAWYSRWEAYSSADFRRIAAMYRRLRLPLDVMVLDMDWHRVKDAAEGFGWAGTLGWTGWSWNRELLPDAENLLEELHQKQMLVALNEHPHDGIRPHEDCFREFQRRCPGHDGHFSPEDKQYMDALFACAVQPLRDAGCDLFWLDWQQDMLFPEVPELRCKVLGFLNCAHTDFDRQSGRRPMLLSRWGGWGDQRSGMKFSGDVCASWRTLAFEVLYTVLAGNALNCFLSHDLGGFSGERNAELFVRWLQFGALSCAMRIHSSKHVPERLPWDYPEPQRKAIFGAYRLHERLMTEIYSAAIECHETALPVVRGMFLMHPEAPEALHCPEEYYLGGNLLAFPVTRPCREGGAAAKVVRIFDGEWFDVWRQISYRPGEYLVERDLDEPGVLVRCGVPLLLDRHGRGKDVFLALPDADGTYENCVRQDDGITPDAPVEHLKLKLTKRGTQFSLELPPLAEGGTLILARGRMRSMPKRLHRRGNFAFLPLEPTRETSIVTFEADILPDETNGKSGFAVRETSITATAEMPEVVFAFGKEASAEITLFRGGAAVWKTHFECSHPGEMLHFPLPEPGGEMTAFSVGGRQAVRRAEDAVTIFEQKKETLLLCDKIELSELTR